MAERTMEYLPVTDLVPALVNPKGHDSAGIEASLRRFGYIDAAVLDERTGRLVGGHGRTDVLAAAQAAGLEPPEGIRVDGDGRWLVPVQRGWHSRDDAEAHAAGLAINRLTEKGGWQRDGLAGLLADLSATDAGLDGTGFVGDDLGALLAELKPTEVEAPPEFRPVDPDSLEVEFRCPRCSYEWSGNPAS